MVLVAACTRAPVDDGMVAVPAATLQMGCDPSRDSSCSPTELPAHAVTAAAFRIDRTEVSQAAYARCVDAGACTATSEPPSRPKAPVTHVTWLEAGAYCRWRGQRLPSEAEWELAARGTDGRIYPWGDAAPDCTRAHLATCGAEPADVGGRLAGASPFGALDIAGNVDEWVADEYRAYGGGAESSGEKVARGGAYDAWHTRSTARSAVKPDFRDRLLGFRCAR